MTGGWSILVKDEIVQATPPLGHLLILLQWLPISQFESLKFMANRSHTTVSSIQASFNHWICVRKSESSYSVSSQGFIIIVFVVQRYFHGSDNLFLLHAYLASGVPRHPDYDRLKSYQCFLVLFKYVHTRRSLVTRWHEERVRIPWLVGFFILLSGIGTHPLGDFHGSWPSIVCNNCTIITLTHFLPWQDLDYMAFALAALLPPQSV